MKYEVKSKQMYVSSENIAVINTEHITTNKTNSPLPIGPISDHTRCDLLTFAIDFILMN
jgi:hypothetical protein